jgi:multidrug efflux system membrane fusion protein
MLVDTLRDATVVPVAAVQRGTPGTFVYAVEPQKKVVSVRRIRLGPAQGERVAIEEGLKPGELVVVDGTDRLREGSTVELVVRDASVQRDAGKRKREDKLSPEERLKRWKELNARIDKGEFGEEVRKLPEEERKKRIRELLRDKMQK